jgi:membrane protein required for colicin V production
MLGSAMNAVDIIVLVVLGVAFLYGILRGFVLQLAGIVFIVGGLVLADRFSPGFGRVLQGWFPELGSPFEHGLAFAMILIGVVVVGHVLALVFRGLIEKLKLLSYDRFLGGILGMLKGALLLVLILWGLVWFFGPRDAEEEPTGLVLSIFESRTWPLVQEGTDAVLPLIPEDLRDRARTQLEKLRDEIPEKAPENTAGG